MSNPTRSYIETALDLVDNGAIDPTDMLIACLKFMGEDAVAEMLHANEFLDGDDEPWDGFNSDAEADADALASIGWGSDEDYGGTDERY